MLDLNVWLLRKGDKTFESQGQQSVNIKIRLRYKPDVRIVRYNFKITIIKMLNK